MKRHRFYSSAFAGAIVLATLLSPQQSPAYDYGDSYYDEQLKANVTKQDWLSRNRVLDSISMLPGESGASSFKDYVHFSCADFNVDAPDGWGVSHNASSGVIGVEVPLDAKPGNYGITVIDSSECFPSDTVSTTLKVTITQPEIAYHLNDKEELIATYRDGTERNVSSQDHEPYEDGIIEYTITDNNVASIKTNDGKIHNLHGDTKTPEYKDNDRKGIHSLSYDENGNGVIIATDGSTYVIDAMKDNLSITDMSVIGDGRLVVVTSDGTARELGVIKDSIYEGISSVFMEVNDSLVVSTTGGKTHALSKDNSSSGKTPQGITSVSTISDKKVHVTTDEKSSYRMSMNVEPSRSPNPGGHGSDRNASNEDLKNKGVYTKHGYTFVPKNPEEAKGKRDQSVWGKFLDILL